MGEQVLGERSAVAPVDGAEGRADAFAPLHAGEPSLRLQQLARARSTVPPAALADIEEALAEVLRGLRKGPEAERAAHVVLSLLEDRVFDGLAGPERRPLRAEAVEAVLRLGYPFALEIEPADLQFLRETQRAERLRPFRRAAVALVLAALAGLGTWAGVRWLLPLVTITTGQGDATAVVGKRPANIGDLIATGRHLFEDGDYEGAVTPLRECVLAQPDDFACRTYLGAALTELGNRTSHPESSVEGAAHLDRAGGLLGGGPLDPAARGVYDRYRPRVRSWPEARPGRPTD